MTNFSLNQHINIALILWNKNTVIWTSISSLLPGSTYSHWRGSHWELLKFHLMASAFQTSTFLFVTFLRLAWVCVRGDFAHSAQHWQVAVGRCGENSALYKLCWHLWICRDHSMPVWALTSLSWKPAAAVSRFGFRQRRMKEMKKRSYRQINFSRNSLIQYTALFIRIWFCND